MAASTLRLFAPALLAVTVALFFVFPGARPGFASEGADAQPGAPASGIIELPVTPLAPTATLADAGTATDVPAAAPQPERPAEPRGYTVVRVRAGRSIALRAGPGGATVKTLTARTEFGSKRVMGVAAVRGRWLGVHVPERPNGKLGWIDGRSAAIDRGRTKVSLRADLSRRTLEVRVGRRVVDRMKVTIGRAGSSTPTGRFAVTDKIAGDRYGPYYGCCILALSGHQPNTPGGWRGGNRLAIHGTNAPGTIGAAASAGCLRGSDRDMRTLMDRVPVGTPVFIKR
jgi:lipoprotein-anchoring transpeptidase ErfK/SrfK